MSYEDSKIGSPWRGYYITAYGLAVKHGYKGSEQQWLASLSGEDGKEVQIRFCEETNQLEQKKEGEAVWRPLLDLSDLQTQVVAQTLSAADNAAASCRTDALSAQSAAESADLDAQQTQADRQAAEDAAQEAQTAKQAAASSAASASSNAGAAYQMSTTAKSWAVGGTGTRPGEDTNNAKYWCDNAAAIAGGGVLSFNGRGGVVIPQAGDYDCAMVGADAAGAAQAAVSAHNSQSGAHATAGGGFRAGTGASSSGDGVGIGKAANGNGDKTIAIGQTAYSYSGGIAIGAGATAGSVNGDTTKAAIQLGAGQNRAGGTLRVFDNLLLDKDGLIPLGRMQHILVNQVSELNTWTQRYEASVTLAENENVKVVSFLYDYDQDYEGRALFLEVTSFDEDCVVTGNIIHDYGTAELEDGTRKSVAHLIFRREQGAASYEKMVFYRVLVAPCLKQKPLEVTS